MGDNTLAQLSQGNHGREEAAWKRNKWKHGGQRDGATGQTAAWQQLSAASTWDAYACSSCCQVLGFEMLIIRKHMIKMTQEPNSSVSDGCFSQFVLFVFILVMTLGEREVHQEWRKKTALNSTSELHC